MNRKTILCVDDEAIIVMSIKQELKSHFRDLFLYETALSASDAFSVIDELNDAGAAPILLISDWLMPGMKGNEFIAKVKKRHPDMQTILVTGHAPKETVAQIADENLISAVLQKPWSSRDLITTVERCLGITPEHG